MSGCLVRGSARQFHWKTPLQICYLSYGFKPLLVGFSGVRYTVAASYARTFLNRVPHTGALDIRMAMRGDGALAFRLPLRRNAKLFRFMYSSTDGAGIMGRLRIITVLTSPLR